MAGQLADKQMSPAAVKLDVMRGPIPGPGATRRTAAAAGVALLGLTLADPAGPGHGLGAGVGVGPCAALASDRAPPFRRAHRTDDPGPRRLAGGEQRHDGDSGARISEPGFDASHWLAVRPDDAGAPGTEIEALLQNGACPDVFYSTNMEKCFGDEHRIGADTVPEFDVPWWFRTDFTATVGTGQHATLIVPGVVGRADLWVDGTEVATQSTIQGDYTRFTFDVTGLLARGANALAFEVFPNDPLTMFTLDDVDWSQIPPDNNTGIQFPVELQTSDAVTVGNDYVTEVNAPDMSTSSLTVHVDVTNAAATAQTTDVTAVITPPAGPTATAPIDVSTPVTVPARTTQTVTFSPAADPDFSSTGRRCGGRTRWAASPSTRWPSRSPTTAARSRPRPRHSASAP